MENHEDTVYYELQGVKSRQMYDVLLCHRVQAGSGVQPASYEMVDGHLSPGIRPHGKGAGHISIWA